MCRASSASVACTTNRSRSSAISLTWPALAARPLTGHDLRDGAVQGLLPDAATSARQRVVQVPGFLTPPTVDAPVEIKEVVRQAIGQNRPHVALLEQEGISAERRTKLAQALRHARLAADALHLR